MGFVPFTFIDLIDILFVAYIMYWIYRTTKGTNAPYIISGIIVVYLLWVIVKTHNMELLSTIQGHIISVGAIALVVIGQQSDLSLITEGGICLDAKISSQLIHNIFFKNSPLHDGAVVIEGDRIVAARCILPVTQSDVPKSFGTRHRAAIGMSEISDAIILVVSEETGAISIANNGRINLNIPSDRLGAVLQKYLISKK